MKALVLLFICILLFQGLSSAQEEVVGLYSNPVIKHELKMMEANGQLASRTELLFPRPIHLPVFDDFHTDHIFPDTAWFSDIDAFINDDFPYRSVNIGAATMDAIDASGNLYPDASMFPFVADHLTSRPVRLDSLFLPGETRAITLADSIYFSFFYQPQGRGNPPESFDSLVLQFGHYVEDSVFGLLIKWEHVWSTEGMRIDTFYKRYNTYSRQVMIPVIDSLKYYNKYFYFRFFNYASLANSMNPSWMSNCDQWNIDYIYLNIDRTAADTFYRAITFAERAPSFLTDFTAMPLRQYRNDPTNQLKDSLKLFITNLSADTFNVFYKYLIDEQGGSYSHTYNGGFANLYPFYLSGYQSCASVPQHACPPRDFLFPLSSLADSSSYNVRHVIHDQSNPDLGDTIYFIQKFYNYYAYDDGTPELGYGLSLAGGKAAYRFILNIADTLKGIGMFFNRVQNDANDQFFTLKVWDNNNGKPGNVIWQQESLKPKFSDELYRMQIYEVNPPLPLIGTFFVGFEQTTADLLNVGFDTHNDASEHTFYNTSGSWVQSLKAGSMLMRPILATFYDPFLVEEYLPDYTWNIYPNPVSGKLLHIQNSIVSEADLSSSQTTISIYDMPGRKVLSMPYSNTVSIDKLPQGMYLLHIMNEDHSINYIHKLLVNN